VSALSILLRGRETADFPAHAVAARFERLVRNGWDARLVCEGSPRLWQELIDPALHSRVRLNGTGPRRDWSRPGRRGGRLVHFPTADAALAGPAAARGGGGRAVVTLGAGDLSISDPPGGYDALWGVVSAVHVPDAGLWERARQRGCPGELPHAVISPAAAPAFLDAPPARDRPEPGRLRLVSVAPLDWTQGYEHAVHAVRLLADRGVACEYRIVGDGDYAAAVAYARYQLGVEERVSVIDPPPPAALREELARADAYLCPAVLAGVSGRLLEALATGLPAVVSDAGGREAQLDGAALVFPRRDPVALADRLAELARDPGLRRTLGRRGRELAMSHPLDEQLDAFERLYGALLSA
jgi:glycosyltransferase involved in cell wall biosynthesis